MRSQQSSQFGAGRQAAQRRRSRAALLAVTAIGACTIATPASAQETEATATEQTDSVDNTEIVVQARRRDEAVQDVPISITVVNQEDLTERGVRSAIDLPTVAPGLSAGLSAGRRNDLVFSQRGQGQAFGGSAPGVAAYFAEVPDFASQIYDLANVAVLKGPQGTLFGRNTTGGAVLLTPAEPEAEWGGYVTARVGDYSRRDVEFAVTGPIAPTLLVRVSGQYLRRDGYAHNLSDGSDVSDENKFSIRGSILFESSPVFRNYTIFQHARTNETGSDNQIVYINTAPAFASPFNPLLAPPGTIDLLAQGQAAVAAQQARGPRVIDVDGGHSNYLKSQGVLNTTTITPTDAITLKNIVSYRRLWYAQVFDFDGSSLPLANTNNLRFLNRQLTEEFQVQYQHDWLNLTGGFYYEDVKVPKYTQFVFTTYWPYPTGVFAPLPAQGTYQAISYDVYSNAKSTAFYAEGTASLTDRLDLTLGIRQTHDVRSGGNSSGLLVGGTTITTAVAAGNVKFDATTYNVSALFRATDALNFYGSFRRGYKAGGVNTTNTGGVNYLPEYVNDYELGAKFQGSVGGVHTFAALDFFYDDYTDIQRNVVLPGLVVATQTQNAAAAKIKGFDAQLRISPSDFFDFGIAYTYVDAKYDEYTDPLYGDLSKGLFPQTPKHQLSADVQVGVPIPERMGTLKFRTNLYYQSKVAFQEPNTLNGTPANDIAVPTSVVPGYALINARLDWDNIAGSNFGASIYVTNLTDKLYVIGTSNLANGPSFASAYSYGAPRMWGVEGRIRF